jgi:hypothetical protein
LPIEEQAPGKYHQGGVTQLQYVSGVDEALGDVTDSPIVSALGFGLMFMGVACLLGAERQTARWLGVAGVGFGLLRR